MEMLEAGISHRIANVVGALTRRMRRAAGRPHASAAAVIRSNARLTSTAKAPAAGVGIIRRPTRTNRRCPSQVSRIVICRLTAPCVSPSSAAAAA
jgi:TRAP-type C4-dicarboxylate transport system permease large subunit